MRGRFLGWFWLVGALALPSIWGQWDQPAWAVTGAVLLGIAAVRPGGRPRARGARRASLARGPARPAARLTRGRRHVDEAHLRWLVGAWAVVATIGWDQAGVVPAVVAVLIWRRNWSPYAKRCTGEATGTALRRHEDPGAELSAVPVPVEGLATFPVRAFATVG